MHVLHYAKYLGAGTDVFSYVDFCGACRQELRHPAAFARTPDDLEREAHDHTYGLSTDREFRHVAYCPWCGIAFDDEWWVRPPIRNQRVIDHYDNPGHHAGDSHEFPAAPTLEEAGSAMSGHWLASTDKTGPVCWCDYTVEPGLLGCTIRHSNDRRPASAKARTAPTVDFRYWKVHADPPFWFRSARAGDGTAIVWREEAFDTLLVKCPAVVRPEDRHTRAGEHEEPDRWDQISEMLAAENGGRPSWREAAITRRADGLTEVFADDDEP